MGCVLLQAEALGRHLSGQVGEGRCVFPAAGGRLQHGVVYRVVEALPHAHPLEEIAVLEEGQFFQFAGEGALLAGLVGRRAVQAEDAQREPTLPVQGFEGIIEIQCQA